MSETERDARNIFQLGLSPIFLEQTGKGLPPDLGPELVRRSRWRLGRLGFVGEIHVQEVLSLSVLAICSFLDDHSASEIALPRAYFHSVFANQVRRYAKKLGGPGRSVALEDTVEPEDNSPWISDQQLLDIVLEEIEALPPRFRRFLRLDLVECLSADEIRAAMHIPTLAYFKRVKYLALNALKARLKNRIPQAGR